MVGAAVIVAMTGRESPDWVGPGLLGLAVVLGLLVALIFLWRSMAKRLKRVRFDDPDASQQDQPDGSPPPTESNR